MCHAAIRFVVINSRRDPIGHRPIRQEKGRQRLSRHLGGHHDQSDFLSLRRHARPAPVIFRGGPVEPFRSLGLLGKARSAGVSDVTAPAALVGRRNAPLAGRLRLFRHGFPRPAKLLRKIPQFGKPVAHRQHRFSIVDVHLRNESKVRNCGGENINHRQWGMRSH